jgi:hypothetical protein
MAPWTDSKGSQVTDADIAGVPESTLEAAGVADPKNVQRKTWPETIADILALPLFMYGGPEAPEGAAFLEKSLYAGGRAALTGAETVGSDIISGLGRKVAGKPSGLTIPGEAERAAQGAGIGLVFEGARPVIKKLTGETKATAAGTEAVTSAREGATGAAKGVTEAGVRGTQEEKGLQTVKSQLGASAPKLPAGTINQETRAAQNDVAGSINAIHRDINQGYKNLFAPYAKNPVKTETITGPLHDLKQELEDGGRMSQVSPKARTLLNDGLSLGSGDPLAAFMPGQDLSKLTKTQRKNLESAFSRFSSKKLEAVPATVEQVLAIQNRANDILRSGTENAASKAVAASTMKSTTAALDEMGDTQFLTPAEKEQHSALKGRTRSFYTDFDPLMKKLWRTQTPAKVGEEIFKQPQHVIEQAIESATKEGKLGGLQRAFADSITPEGATLLGDKGIVPKLQEMDRKGLLQKLYPGRYGKLQDWLDTAAQQKKLESLAKVPATQAQMANGVRMALDSAEGKTFMNAAQQALKPKGAVPNFMIRWVGLYQPIEAIAMGMGMMKKNIPMAVAGLATYFGTTAFKRFMADDAFREAYYKAITNPNVQQATYSLSRLAMGMAVKEMNSQQQPDASAGAP